MISLTKEEEALILANREIKEREEIERGILYTIDQKFKGSGHDVSFNQVAKALCIETLRGLYAGVKSRPQKLGYRFYNQYSD